MNEEKTRNVFLGEKYVKYTNKTSAKIMEKQYIKDKYAKVPAQEPGNQSLQFDSMGGKSSKRNCMWRAFLIAFQQRVTCPARSGRGRDITGGAREQRSLANVHTKLMEATLG